MVSKSADNYLLAHYLAKQAYEGGSKEAKITVGWTIDRSMTFTEGYQKYGTQRLYNQTTGKNDR